MNLRPAKKEDLQVIIGKKKNKLSKSMKMSVSSKESRKRSTRKTNP
jgi:phosphotransferase system IIB component